VPWQVRQSEKRSLKDDVRYTVRSRLGLIEKLHSPRQTLLSGLATPKKSYRVFGSAAIQSSPRSPGREKRPLIPAVSLFLVL